MRVSVVSTSGLSFSSSADSDSAFSSSSSEALRPALRYGLVADHGRCRRRRRRRPRWHRLGAASSAVGTAGCRPRWRRIGGLVPSPSAHAAVGRFEIDDVAQQHPAFVERVAPGQQRGDRQRAFADAADHLVPAGLDALGDLDLALAAAAARRCPSRAGTCAPDRRCGRAPRPRRWPRQRPRLSSAPARRRRASRCPRCSSASTTLTPAPTASPSCPRSARRTPRRAAVRRSARHR